MNKMQQPTKPKRPRWLYIVGIAVLICFALAFVPGGQAMPILGSWIAGWAFCFWLFRRYRWVRILVTIGFIVIALGAYLIVSAGQAGRLFYGY
jgi:hypothetical protein